MTLEHKIAECNGFPEPLKWFIETRDITCPDPTIDSMTTMFGLRYNKLGDLMFAIANTLSLDWLNRESLRLLHPIVVKLLDEHECDWYGLMLEWPHVSQDGERLGYTRNTASGINDRQTVTTLGKYLARHWPNLPDHTRRDAAALFTPDKFAIYDTTEYIVHGVQTGPASCMQWADHEDITTHPYSCYAPENGWTLAVRIAGGRIDGRCLCHTKADKRIFVRSFARDVANPESGYSHSDTKLEAWLKDQGYEHRNEWVSYCQLDTKDSALFPYVDGGTQRCDDNGFITEDGCYNCTNTDGSADQEDEDESMGDCDACGDTVYENNDDRIWVGRNEDVLICGECAHNYTHVHGRNSNTYYVYEDRVVYVDDEAYDEDYLADNDIVELEDGGFAHRDNAVLINDKWYLEDDDDVTYFNDEYHLISADNTVELGEPEPGNGARYAHTDDTWECEETGKIYHNKTPFVLIDGEKYHASSDAAQAKQTELELEPS